MAGNLTNHKLCYIPICKSWRKRQRMFLRMVGTTHLSLTKPLTSFAFEFHLFDIYKQTMTIVVGYTAQNSHRGNNRGDKDIPVQPLTRQ